MSRPITDGEQVKALNLTFKDVRDEYRRARDKHGDYVIDGPNYSDPDRYVVLMEEVGEVAHELTYDAVGEDDQADRDRKLYAELIQVATMALAWAGEVARR